MNDKPSTILYDHYKDTSLIIREAIRRRDRSLVFVLLILGLFSIQALFPATTGLAIFDYLKYKFGLDLWLNLSVLGNLIWVFILLFALRYFQTSVFVERQHSYIHYIEDKLNSVFNDDIVTREGKSYLSDYPHFSSWMWVLYTIVFPGLLFLATFAKIVVEYINVYKSGYNISFFFDTTIFVLLTTSTVLYIRALHLKKDNKEKK